MGFHDATQAKYDGAILKDQGRALLIDGHIYYSPNCQRTVRVPERRRKEIQIDPHSQSITDFHEPMWWTMEYVHLAFLDLDVSVGLAFSTVLDVSLRFPKLRSGKFSLDTSILFTWKRLEYYLQGAADVLLSSSHVPDTPQVIQTALVCTGRFEDHRELRKLVVRARDWFSYWFGRISYAIAVAISSDEQKKVRDRDPLEATIGAWAGTLKESEWSQAFISAIYNASGRFENGPERVGLFMDLVNLEKDQFSVDWLCRFGIPVWYPWGDAEKKASQTNLKLARLAPLPHQLQDIATFLTSAPTPVMQTKPSWLIFKENWEKRRKELKLIETPEHRRSREDRERNPSWKQGSVFEWTNIDGVHIRQRIETQGEYERVLGFYGRNQRLYDGFTKEWDCCSQFGDREEDEIERDSEYDDNGDYEMAEDQGSVTDPMGRGHEMVVSMAPLLSATEVEQEFQTVDILKEYFGFVPPLPLIPLYPKPVYSPADCMRHTITLGLCQSDHTFFNDAIAGHAIEFLNQYAVGSAASPRADLWDLSLGNRTPLAAAKRLKFLYCINNSLYVFNFGKDATVPWNLAVESATIALMVCRLDERLNDYGIVWMLILRGIKVRTLLPIRRGQRIQNPPTMRVPVRLPGYDFHSLSDYATYQTTLNNLLRIPRIARAAIEEGGIVWRIAFSRSSFTDVLSGPTSQLLLHNLGRTFRSDDGHSEWCDDICSEHELDAICGAYICFQGMQLK